MLPVPDIRQRKNPRHIRIHLPHIPLLLPLTRELIVDSGIHIIAHPKQNLIRALIVLILNRRPCGRRRHIRHHLLTLRGKHLPRPALPLRLRQEQPLTAFHIHRRRPVYLPRQRRLLHIAREICRKRLLRERLLLRHLLRRRNPLEIRHILIQIALQRKLHTRIVLFAHIRKRLIDRRRRPLHQPLRMLTHPRRKKPVLAVELLRQARHHLIARLHHIGGIQIILTLRRHLIHLPERRRHLRVPLTARTVGIHIPRGTHSGRTHHLRIHSRLIACEPHPLPPPARIVIREPLPERSKRRIAGKIIRPERITRL